MIVFRSVRGRVISILIVAGLLSGCLRAAEGPAPILATPSPLAAEVSPIPSETPVPTVAVDPAAPAILVTRPVGEAAIVVIRYLAGAEICLAASFDLRVLESSHCGSFDGVGVVFTATLTNPQGQAVPVAYGGLFDSSVTAVAIEFAGGGNASAQVENGGFLLLLQPGQIPQRAVGINQFGNLVGNLTVSGG